MKISEAFEAYKNDFIYMGGQSVRTAEMHDYVCKNIIETIGNIDIRVLTLEHIREWFKTVSRDRGQNTVRGYIIKLRRVLTYCKNRDMQVIEPNLIQVPKRQDTVPVFLYPEEVTAMIDTASNLRAKFVISLLYSSGIRLSELISLNRGQIYKRKFTVIGKGGVPRLCFIDERTEELMGEYLESRHDNDSALVVSYENKNRITKTNVQLIMRNAAHRAGITKKVTPHTMRHSFATNFLRNGGNIRVLQVLLGHKSVETTMVYTHVVDNDLEEQYLKHHSV